MRISDWSSDVCSSDLGGAVAGTARRLDPLRVGTPAPEQSGNFLRRRGPAEQISLPIFAALGAKRHRLLRRFHTFGHHLDAKIASQADDRGHDCGVVAQMRNVADEGTVDLQRVDREIGRATPELPSLMRSSYAVFCLTKKTAN